MRHASFVLVVSSVLFAICGVGGAQCALQWSDRFGSPDIPGGHCMVVHDDGTGPALYIGLDIPYGGYGQYQQYGVIRWRGPGTIPERVGGHSALQPSVKALAVYDDGNGPALYATGAFTSTGSIPCDHIARWNGTNWVGVGAGLAGTGLALAVYDDGAGPALYVGGEFQSASGVPAARLAKWNGTAWSAV